MAVQTAAIRQDVEQSAWRLLYLAGNHDTSAHAYNCGRIDITCRVADVIRAGSALASAAVARWNLRCLDASRMSGTNGGLNILLR